MYSLRAMYDITHPPNLKLVLRVAPPPRIKDCSNRFHFTLSLSPILTMILRQIATKCFRKEHRLFSNSDNSMAFSRLTTLEEDKAAFCGESASTISSRSPLFLSSNLRPLCFSLCQLSSSKHHCLPRWICP